MRLLLAAWTNRFALRPFNRSNFINACMWVTVVPYGSHQTTVSIDLVGFHIQVYPWRLGESSNLLPIAKSRRRCDEIRKRNKAGRRKARLLTRCDELIANPVEETLPTDVIGLWPVRLF